MALLRKSNSNGTRIAREIKQPLAAISMLAGLAMDDLKEPADKQRAKKMRDTL